MPIEKVTGNANAKFGNASVIGVAGWEILGDITITERNAINRTMRNGKVVRKVGRDTGLDASFTVLIDSSATVKKFGDTIAITTQHHGLITFVVDQVDELRKDAADGTYAYKCSADEGIDYTSA
jgi:hypothetical protein